MWKESGRCFEMRDIDPNKAPRYITKSEEFLGVAKLAAQNEKYTSAVTNAIHSAISALDALTTSYKGKRASDDHTEVLALAAGIFSPKEYREVKRQFISLIDKKNASEYQPDLMEPKDAQDSIKWAERILNKVKTKLKG
ncbi:HEPN domain protein [Marine Group I thaumarchaeote SCGC RSA3]|uniref:HEPN domain protein n=2 Tax=Marine Group I TaxID=905826 RepID=A0A087RQL4_9ARCH|nr:HEPN domain protein [Marine Group I thaumarchaeote SCGC RSA3]